MKNLVELTNYEFEILYAGLLLSHPRRPEIASMKTWFALRDRGLVRVTINPRPGPVCRPGNPPGFNPYDVFVTDLGLEVINKAPALMKFIVAGKYNCWSSAYRLVQQLSIEELPAALASNCFEVREFAQQMISNALE